jgi:GH43 family beta-xylosidase
MERQLLPRVHGHRQRRRPEYVPSVSTICHGLTSLPVVASNWWTLDSRPVMWSSSSAFGPGHASFPSDRNGVPYVVYHADAQSGAGWNGRTIRTQPFGWNADNSPAFPSPAGLGQAFAMPA